MHRRIRAGLGSTALLLALVPAAAAPPVAAPIAAVLVAAGPISAGPVAAGPIKVSTWNLDWLTLRHTGDPALPDDVTTRAPADFASLAVEAARLHPDIVAIEEVDGSPPASLLFPARDYTILMTNDDVVQRVGLVVRRTVAVTRNPDVTALDVEPNARHRLRSGLDATVTVDGVAIRVLAVHLKTGCWGAEQDASGKRACRVLNRQIPVLADWVRDRTREGVPFLVLGDFNRHLGAGGDRVMAALAAAGPIDDPDRGQSSPCWGGDDFIDHILLGGPARNWMVPGSLRVLVYRDRNEADKDRLSDHCPVSVTIEPR